MEKAGPQPSFNKGALAWQPDAQRLVFLSERKVFDA